MSKPSFPQYVRILCWVADGLLMLFALSIFIAYGPGMSPTMAVILALSIFLGGLLPLLAHYIEYLFEKLAINAQEAAAPQTIKEVTERLDQLLKRVEGAAADAARTTLTARQIPSQIQSSTEGLQRTQSDLGALLSELDKLPSSHSVEALVEKLEPRESAVVDLDPLTKRLDALEGEIEKALLVREDKLEEIIEQLQQFEESLDLLSDSTRPAAEEIEPSSASEPAPAEPEVTVAKKPPAKKKRASKAKPSPQADLFAQETLDAPASEASTRLIAKAMVGVSNEIFIRGESPLSWEEGIALEATGIGEWRIELNEIEVPIEVELRLNDEIAAKGPTLTIEPGKTLQVSPEFPTETEPF